VLKEPKVIRVPKELKDIPGHRGRKVILVLRV